jgi:hypothetical protein
MILKLIETNATPKIGDLVWDTDMKKCHILDGLKLKVIISKNCGYYKLVKPYGVSDDEVTGHGFRLDVERNTIGIIDDDDWYRTQPDKFKKVSIFSEQFNYQEIVDLGLKDGDEFKADIMCHNCDGTGRDFNASDMSSRRCRHCHGTGRARKVSISKPTPEKDIDMLLNEFGNELMNKLAWNKIEKSSNGIAQFVTEFLNKKK